MTWLSKVCDAQNRRSSEEQNERFSCIHFVYRENRVFAAQKSGNAVQKSSGPSHSSGPRKQISDAPLSANQNVEIRVNLASILTR